MSHPNLLPRLYHYTCEHSVDGIERDWQLRPWGPPVPYIEPVVWLTDLDVPVREPLGLTMLLTACDRTAHRYEVNLDAIRPDLIHPWWRYARTVDPEYREELETAPGAMPMHWWVSTVHVPVLPLRPRRQA